MSPVVVARLNAVIVTADPRNRNHARAPATPLTTNRPPAADGALRGAHRAESGVLRAPFLSTIASTPVAMAAGWPGSGARMLTCSWCAPCPDPVKVRATRANDRRCRSIVVRYLPSIATFARPNVGPATVQRVTEGPENAKAIEAPTRRSQRYEPPRARASGRVPHANEEPGPSSGTTVAARKLAAVLGRGFEARSTIAGVTPFGFATTR